MDDPQDICRVCRCEGQAERPLFYPCICTGSIKYIHQDCLMQWMRYSHKEYCELCGHRFSFQPIYSPDMPSTLPLRDIAGGLLQAFGKAAKSWFHYTLVGLAWFGVVPLSAYRTYRYLFRASTFDMILSLPVDVFSTDNLASDVFRGCFVVTCTLLSFIGLVWLREQILHGGGPDWLERDDMPAPDGGEDPEAADVLREVAANIAANQQQRQPNAPEGDEDGDDEEDDDGEEEEAVAGEGAPAGPRNIGPAAQALLNAMEQADDEGYVDDEEGEAPGDMAPINNAGGGAAEAAAEDGANRLEFLQRLPELANLVNRMNDGGGGGEAAPRGEEDNDDDDNNEVPADGVAGVAAAGGAFEANNLVDDVPVDNDNDNDEPNWNPMEWDRAAEELTWERLLGLDGSLLFLEHVFWIISLNTMFIFTFAFCPYCIGNFVLSSLELLQPDKPLLHFHGLVTTLFGYCIIGLSLVVLHFFARVFNMRRMRSLIGLCYIVVKVTLLSVVEIGVLPLVCGWWLDICSLPLFDANIKERKANFEVAPGTSLFVHWMFGMVYVYYFAAFISLLREVVRPGVLWFLRNLNDPDFSPIQEMIHLPILRHVRRLITSAIIFGTAVLLMLWLPIRFLKSFWPSFLPYTLSGDSEVNELSLQLLLLQIILPGFFEQSHTRIWLKAVVRVWCICVSWVLGIRSYLLGADKPAEKPATADAEVQADVDAAPEPANDAEDQADNDEAAAEAAVAPPEVVDGPEAAAAAAPAPPAPAPAQPAPVPPARPPAAENNLAAAHQAIIQRDVPVAFQPYERPTFFALRLCGLMVFIGVSLVIASVITLTVPVWIGRQVMSLWSVGSHIATSLETSAAPTVTAGAVATAVGGGATVAGSPRPHELYTAAIGTYLCWIISRCIAIVVSLVPLGRAVIRDKIRSWFLISASYALPVLIFVLMLGVIPLLFGLLLELVVVIPLRVPVYQTPIHFLFQDWALGVLYTKIAIALTLMGPDWHLKRAIERAYMDGLRDIDLKFLITELAVPVITCFGLALAVPYVFTHSIVPLVVSNQMTQMSIAHTVYPGAFILVVTVAYAIFQVRQLKKFYVAIKVDKYLVGQRLVNYEHRKKQQQENEVKAIAAAAAAEAARASSASAASSSSSAAKESPSGSLLENPLGEGGPSSVLGVAVDEDEPLELLGQDALLLRRRRHEEKMQREALVQDLVRDELL